MIRKQQAILVVMILGLLMILNALGAAQPASAQAKNSPTPTNTKTPSPTPLGGLDAKAKAKIIQDINNNLNKGENNFVNLKFDEAKTLFQATLDSVHKYKVNDAFLNDK